MEAWEWELEGMRLGVLKVLSDCEQGDALGTDWEGGAAGEAKGHLAVKLLQPPLAFLVQDRLHKTPPRHLQLGQLQARAVQRHAKHAG